MTMRMLNQKWSVKQLSSVSLIIACCFSLVCCEQVQEDVLPENLVEQLEPQILYAIPGEPVVVDLLEGVSFTSPVELKVSESPAAGELMLMDKSLALYEQRTRPSGATDTFILEMRSGSQTYTRGYEVRSTDRVGYPLSEQGAVYDRGGILTKDSSLVVDVLANDVAGAGSLEIEVPPAHGTAAVTEDQKILYTADTEYLGLVDLIYRVEFGNGNIGRAIVRFAITE